MNRTRPQKRGYTLVEVTLVAALTAAVLALLLRWLVGLGSVVAANLSVAETGTLTRAATQIQLDVTTAGNCTSTRVDARARQVAADRLELVLPSPSGYTSVVWKIENGTLQRGEAPMLADCEFTQPATWTTWSHNIDSDASAFSTVANGAANPEGTSGVCENEFASRCQVNSIELRLKNTNDALELHRVTPLS